MSDIKSISHQSIHSTQSAAEGSQKKPEIEKEYKPAEFRPLSNEQKESIKLTRNAENKMAESAFMSGITRGLEEYNKRSDKSISSAAGSDTVKNELSKEFVKAGSQNDIRDIVKSPKEFLPIQTGPTAEYQSSEPVLKAEKFFPTIRFTPATPILDGEAEREEEPIAATEPPSIKSGDE